jgi:hypothetical protein
MLSVPVIIVVSVLLRIGLRALFFQKREPIDTSRTAWTPPPHVLFGTPPQQPIAPQAPAAPASYEPRATFAPPPSAAAGGFAPPPAPGSAKAELPPPVDLNDVFRRPSAG